MNKSNILKVKITLFTTFLYVIFVIHTIFWGLYYEGRISGITLLDYWGLTYFFTISIFLILLIILILKNKRR